MDLGLTGKVALVTGAGRGIGAAIARTLAQAGALVVVNYLRNAASAAQVEAQCQQGGGGWAYQADVTDTTAVQAMVQAVLKEEMGEDDKKLWAERAVHGVNAVFPEVEHSNWPTELAPFS